MWGQILVHLFVQITFVLSLPLPQSVHQQKLLLRKISSEENFEAPVVAQLEHLEDLLEELSRQENLSEDGLIVRRSKRQAFLTCHDLTFLIKEYDKVIRIVIEILRIVKTIQNMTETSNHETLEHFLKSQLSCVR